eukprot:augustus_masked-scaffold_27-processed-gene-1.6-mRNA-1 protein AED:1.00 eAED:1.00 QI:0/-1/0/0/-1/1/1/0/581
MASSSKDCNQILLGRKTLNLLTNVPAKPGQLYLKTVNVVESYIKHNSPLRLAAVSENRKNIVVAGKRGAAVYLTQRNKWKIFGSYSQESEVRAEGLFWVSNNIFCILNRSLKLGEQGRSIYELLFYPKDHLDTVSLLAEIDLPEKPLAVDCSVKDQTMVVQNKHDIMVFHIVLVTDDQLDRPISFGQGQLKFSLIQRVKTYYKFPRADTLLPIFQEAAQNISFLPVGGTTKPGSRIKLPKCLVLTYGGNLYVVDTESKYSSYLVTTNVDRIFIETWNQVEKLQSKGSHLLKSQRQNHLPGKLLFSVWICGSDGVRLWLPSLDTLEPENHSFVSLAQLDFEVSPFGILEKYGLLLGITQKMNILSLNQNKEPMFCFQVSLRLQPVTHALLLWLIEGNKNNLAADVILECRRLFTMFEESIQHLIYQAVEVDYAGKSNPPLLPRVLALLLKGKNRGQIYPDELLPDMSKNASFSPDTLKQSLTNSEVVFPTMQSFASTVVTCARKLEREKWDILFPLIGSVDQYFNSCIYSGDLHTAAAFLLICDHFHPGKSLEKVQVLKKLAKSHNDDQLLRDILHFEAVRN